MTKNELIESLSPLAGDATVYLEAYQEDSFKPPRSVALVAGTLLFPSHAVLGNSWGFIDLLKKQEAEENTDHA